MTFELMKLPYALDALAPVMSRETLEYHYGKHHKAYVDKLNELIVGTKYEKMDMEEIIEKADKGPIFNNAAQIWNHDLFWNSLIWETESRASFERMIQEDSELKKLIDESFGGLSQMQAEFKKEALARFGSGWVWIVEKKGKLKIYSCKNAVNPIIEGGRALLGLDVWEHSYYIDYRNDRGGFVDNFWKIVNWDTVASRVK